MSSVVSFEDCPKGIQMVYNNILHFVSEVAPRLDVSFEYEINKYNKDSYFIRRISKKEKEENCEFFFPILNIKKSLSLHQLNEIFSVIGSHKTDLYRDVKVYTALLNTDGTVLYYEINES